jgi:hypothetical protein
MTSDGCGFCQAAVAEFTDYDGDTWRKASDGTWTCYDQVTGGPLFIGMSAEFAHEFYVRRYER